MMSIYEQVCKDRGFDPRYDIDRPRREFVAWWYSKGELGV